jgi:predicted peroxiredoxin
MERLVIEICHAPYGRQNASCGLAIAGAWASAGMKVLVALHNDGVYSAKKGGTDPRQDQLPSVQGQIKGIIEAGGRVLADLLCMEVRGITEEMLVDGVEVSDGSEMVDLAHEEGEGVITF